MAGELQQVWDGTPTTVIATTGTIQTLYFSVSGTNATITEFDNSAAADRWWLAVARLSVEGFASAPTAGETIDLYMCVPDYAGSNYEAAPTTSAQQGAKQIGSFRMYATTSAQNKSIVIPLSGVRKAKFYIKNSTSQTLSYTSGATVTIEGFGGVPKA